MLDGLGTKVDIFYHKSDGCEFLTLTDIKSTSNRDFCREALYAPLLRNGRFESITRNLSTETILGYPQSTSFGYLSF